MSDKDLCQSCTGIINQKCPLIPKSGNLPITRCDSYRNVFDELALYKKAMTNPNAWRDHTCGECGYWLDWHDERPNTGSEIYNYSQCRKFHTGTAVQPACPDFTPREPEAKDETR